MKRVWTRAVRIGFLTLLTLFYWFAAAMLILLAATEVTIITNMPASPPLAGYAALTVSSPELGLEVAASVLGPLYGLGRLVLGGG